MPKAIELAGLTKRFGALTAVDQLSLSVETGTIYGLVGPNGAGKTTTFGILCGYLRRSGGIALVLGQDPERASSLKGRVSALPQDAALPAFDTVGECLTLYSRLLGRSRRAAEEEARGRLEQVGLEGWWKARASDLSHGMAKRVALAQAFLGDPELVLLDEPTAGLDPKSAHQIRELVAQMKGRRTVVISSHNLSEIESLCDAAAILDRGRVVLAGPMAELTRATAEVRIELAQPAALDALRGLACVSDLSFEPARRLLTVRFSPEKHAAEDVIGEVLKQLLAQGAKISGVQRGRSLEERVVELG